MSYTHYLKIKDKVCIVYEGYSKEYLVLLKMLRESLEEAMPEFKITYAYKEEKPGFISLKDYKKEDYCHTITLIYDAVKARHPILDLLVGVEINKFPVKKRASKICVICAEGDFPVKSLQNTKQVCEWARRNGFSPMLIGSATNKSSKVDFRPNEKEIIDLAINSGLVIGVECDLLYEAVEAGTPTALIPTGVGKELYKILVENPQILYQFA